MEGEVGKGRQTTDDGPRTTGNARQETQDARHKTQDEADARCQTLQQRKRLGLSVRHRQRRKLFPENTSYNNEFAQFCNSLNKEGKKKWQRK